VDVPNSLGEEVPHDLSPAEDNCGRVAYAQGDLDAAIACWQQAVEQAIQAGDGPAQVQALNYLALTWQDLGQWDMAQQALDQAIARLEQLPATDLTAGLRGQTLTAQGYLEVEIGKPAAAFETWEQAAAAYAQAGQLSGQLGAEINQARALRLLGQQRRAIFLLETVAESLANQPPSSLKAIGLRSLGLALADLGDYRQAKQQLEASWTLSDQLNNRAATGATLLALGNVARSLGQPETALDYYQAAEDRATTDLDRLRAQANRLSLLSEMGQGGTAWPLLQQIHQALDRQPPSHALSFVRLHLARTWARMPQHSTDPNLGHFLAKTVQIAQGLEDYRVEAYARVELGGLYGRLRRWDEAQQVTQFALDLARTLGETDLQARAAAQLGQIAQTQGQTPQAIAAYREAYEAFQALRSDLVAIDTGLQFDFRTSVEPTYRAYVGLLLQPNSDPLAIDQARQVIEALQLAELDDFFGDACVTYQAEQLEQLDRHAAVLYPILLPDRMEVIVTLPDQPMRHQAVSVPAATVSQTVNNFFASLNPVYSRREHLRLAGQLYDWIIRPFAADLQAMDIQTLTFVLDGVLRNVPMAALHDGDRYLLETYAIATSPGLQLISDSGNAAALAVLAAGLTEARQGFAALPGVAREVNDITTEIQNTDVMLNAEFTRDRFQGQLANQDYPVVHLATHGQFSSDPEQTFLLTWGERIGVKDLDRLLQQRQFAILSPIELLVMSACQTAAGDDRATLGLAGFALRSGARSTVASLWSVNDESTAALMAEFYRQLAQRDRPVQKAEALRQAQLTLLHNPAFRHPYFWSAFVLVGNWL
jgi:CHAT domain-containing protein